MIVKKWKTAKSTEQFIKESKKINKNKFDYSLVDYINGQTKVKLICIKHGIFEQQPNSHIANKQGCPACAGNKPLNNKSFTVRGKLKYGNKFDYSLVNYKGIYTPIKIKCNDCDNIFDVTPNTFLNGNYTTTCNVCDNKILTEKLITNSKLIHGNKLDYSKTIYGKSKEKCIFICKKHGEFLQSPDNHIRQKQGCPSCINLNRHGENIIKKWLDTENIKYIMQHKFQDCKNILPLSFDFYLIDHNICIEFDGPQHFQPLDYFGGVPNFILRKHRDKIKNKFCKINRIPLIRVKYDIKNINKFLNKKIFQLIENETINKL